MTTIFASQTGAVGDGIADDTLPLQAGIDQADCFVFDLPHTNTVYRVTNSLKIGRTNGSGNIRICGEGSVRNGAVPCAHVCAAMADPVLVTGTQSSSTALNRGITLDSVAAYNTGPVLDLTNATNWLVNECAFASMNCLSQTVNGWNSIRGAMINSNVSCSGGGWAIVLIKCNAARIHGCQLTAGEATNPAGGAIHVEQSQQVSLRNNQIETSMRGFAVSTGLRPGVPGIVPGAGNCYGTEITHNYFERCQWPLAMGCSWNGDVGGQTVFGANVSHNHTGNLMGDQPLFELGRVHGSSIIGNQFYRLPTTTSPAIRFQGNTQAIGNQWAKRNVILANIAQFGSGPLFGYDLNQFGNLPANIAADNSLQTSQGAW